jgi:redox-sensitive bicupin YhaK (pirin superfamily)
VSGPISEADAGLENVGGGVPVRVLDVLPSRLADVAGTPVHRALPRRARRTIGAWCFLDHFRPDRPDDPPGMIGPHPHIGLQTVTWLLAGESLHTDSLGSEQLIRPGQLNLMTAGAGVAHAEDGRESGRAAHGVQLWVAQPEATRHALPAFEHHRELPKLDLGCGEATVLVGELAGAHSTARTDSPLVGADLSFDGGIALSLHSEFEYGFVVLTGAIAVDGTRVDPDALVYLGRGRDELSVRSDGPTRALLLGGTPFEEILMWWNFVARTHDEVNAAYGDWESHSARFGTVASSLPRIAARRPAWMPSGPA